jgi:NAD(P) transhydrogenase subunit alpha
MRVVVPAESKAGEKRVALVPDIISKLTRAGLTVAIQSGAGMHSGATDEAYRASGAEVFDDTQLTAELGKADVVLSVQPLNATTAQHLKSGAITISFLSPTTSQDSIDALAKVGATAFSALVIARLLWPQNFHRVSSHC